MNESGTMSNTIFILPYTGDVYKQKYYTVYAKTFEWENFHGFHNFSLNCEYIIPMDYLNM